MIDEALRIVNVSILRGATGLGGIGDVGEIDEDEASSATPVTRIGTNRDDVIGGSSTNDVMSAPKRKLAKVVDILLRIEFLGPCREGVPPRANVE